MTTNVADAESGSNGATVSTSDSGSPAWDAVAIGTGATLTYSSTGGCKRGSRCYAFSVGGTSANAYAEWNVNAGAATTTQYQRGYIDPADFSGAPLLARGMDSAGSTQRWRLVYSGGTVLLRDSGNATIATSSSLSSGTRYRVEWQVQGTTTGAARLFVYVGESTTPTYDSLAQTGNFGGAIQRVRAGQGAAATSVSGKFDDFGWSDTAAIGPAVRTGASALSATGTLTAAGAASAGGKTGAAALSGTGTLTAAARRGRFGASALSGTGTLTAAARRGRFGASVLSGTGTLAAAGLRRRFGAAALSAASTLTAAGAALPAPIGKPFLPALLGPAARKVVEMAFGADLTDITGAGWTWYDVTDDVRHGETVAVTQGRADNVTQTPTARCAYSLNNAAGNYTPLNPIGIYYPTVTLNTPVRQRFTLDGVTWYTRYQGYVEAMPPRYDTSAKVKIVPVTALGMLNRIAGRKKPLRSPLFRAITAIALVGGLTALWALEDGSSSSVGACAVSGVASMAVGGDPNTVTFGATSDLPGSAAVVNVGYHGTLSADLHTQPLSGYLGVRLWFKVDPGTEAQIASQPLVLTLAGAGTSTAIQVNFNGTMVGSSVRVDLISPGSPGDGLTLDTWTNINVNPFDGAWHEMFLEYAESGGGVNGTLYVDGVSGATGTVASTTLNPVSKALLTANLGPTSVDSYSMLALGTDPAAVPLYTAGLGYAGETADARLTRLCGEEGIDLTLAGTSTTTMGPQGIDTLLNVLRECEATDHGVLYDGFGPGIGYQCRSVRYDAATALTLDMGASPEQVAPPFEPAFDKQGVHNLYVVTRKGGSSATYEKVAGPRGTAAIGVEDTTATVNTDSDGPLYEHAGWLTNLETIGGYRYPTLSPNLMAVPSLAADLLAAGAIGYRVTVNNPASNTVDYPPDSVELFAEGWTETTSASTWDVTANCSRADMLVDIGVYGSTAHVSRYESDGTTLSAPITSTANSFTVAVPSGPLWLTGSSLGLDMTIGGERITVGTISGASSPQTFSSVTRSVNGVVKAHAAGEQVTLTHPAYYGL
jgi:hypothetical protein